VRHKRIDLLQLGFNIKVSGNECWCDGISHIENSLLDPFAPVGGGRGIAEFKGFMNSGGGARRDEACKSASQELVRINLVRDERVPLSVVRHTCTVGLPRESRR
jgi:hypothetical protein